VNSSLLDRVSLHEGDITKLEVDAIVNAANRSLLGGGGVDGAIHRAAGPELYNECKELNQCETGSSKITKGYKLPAKYVIHTVGPIYESTEIEKRQKQLRSCYRTSLDLALEYKIRHIAFPSISTGVYRYPKDDAAHVALSEVRAFLDTEAGDQIEQVIFVVFNPGFSGGEERDIDIYKKILPLYFPPE